MGSTQESAIFWDYENCPAPAGWSGLQVVKCIRDLAQQWGPIKLFKAYLSIAEQSQVARSTILRSEIQASGVSLTDSPHNGRKDVADKMMIVDMLTYAMDNPAPATMIVISGDRDFAYAISTLRLRQYDIVLITLSNAHPSLTSQASVCYDWTTEVLGATDSNGAQAQQESGSGMKGDADGFRFPPLRTAPLFSPNTPSKAVNVPLPRTSPRKLSTARSPSSSFNLIKAPGIPNDNSTSGVTFSPRLFQNAAPFQSNTRSNMDPNVDTDDTTGDIFHQFYSRKVGTHVPSSHGNDSGHGEEDPFAMAYGSYPSPRISSSSPERPLSRALPMQSNLEAGSPTPQRTSFKSVPISAGFDIARPLSEFPRNPVSNALGTPAISEASCASSSQYGSAPEEAEPLGEPIELKPSGSNNNLKSPAPTPIPPVQHFNPLITLLQSYHARGIPRPFRPSIAMEIISANNSVYASLPNVKNFTDYAQLAAKAGIVDIGGEGGEGWIALKPEYLHLQVSP